ncbi:MAG: hypothetical protein GYA23_00165 [Methanomicrobiales archaeon]|nr:hypothetical protein [Methanomicrobiales archaeon]
MDRRIVPVIPIAIILTVLVIGTVSANAPFPTVLDSGVSEYRSADGKLLEEKYTWTKADSGKQIAAWIQIPKAGDITWSKSGCTDSLTPGCTGTIDYYASWRIITPDGKEWLPLYQNGIFGEWLDTDKGRLFVASPKFFRDAAGTARSNTGGEFGGPHYFTESFISDDYQWQGEWTVELYIHNTAVNPRTTTQVAVQHFTLSESGITTTAPTTTATTPRPSKYTVVDSGTSTYQVSGPLLTPKTTWKSTDTGTDANICAWIKISPSTSMGDGLRPQFTYRLFTPDGKDWFKDINPSGIPAVVDSENVNIAQIQDFYATNIYSNDNLEYGEARFDVEWISPRHNANRPSYQFAGQWNVDMIRVDYDGQSRTYTKVKTLSFTMIDESTTKPVTSPITVPPTNPVDAGKGYIEAEDYSGVDVQKTGAEWDSTVEKCPTWRGNDWSGTGDYYLSHGGDTLTYTFTVPTSATYILWMRDSSDLKHAKGAREVTLQLDGKTIGTFDAAAAFNRGTTGYGWDKLTTIDLSSGRHTLKVTKKDTTSAAAVLDVFWFSPDLNEVPSGYITHSTSLCSAPVDNTNKGGLSSCPATGTAVYAESRTMKPGSTVEIPIMICNVKDLANMDMVVTYDTSVLKFKSAEKGGLNANALFESNEPSRGTIKISFASSNGNSGSGSIAILKFDVIGAQGSTSPIKITVNTASTSSGSTITVDVTPGTFTAGTADTISGGKITSRDALAALQMAVGKIPVDTNYDVTKDGSVNSADARAILKKAVSSN